MKPVVDGLSKKHAGTTEFRLLNVESDKDAVALANTLGVQYVPTFLFVDSNGVIAQQKVGEMTEGDIVAALGSLK